MTDFENVVEEKLNVREETNVAILWDEIYKSYDKGGPDAVEELILAKLNGLKRGVTREVKDIKGIIPKKRKKGRR